MRDVRFISKCRRRFLFRLFCWIELLHLDAFDIYLERNKSPVEYDGREERQGQGDDDEADREIGAKFVVNGGDEDGTDEAGKAPGRRQNAHP